MAEPTYLGGLMETKRDYTPDWIQETSSELTPLEFGHRGQMIAAIEQWIEDEDAGFSAACDLIHGIREYLALH